MGGDTIRKYTGSPSYLRYTTITTFCIYSPWEFLMFLSTHCIASHTVNDKSWFISWKNLLRVNVCIHDIL